MDIGRIKEFIVLAKTLNYSKAASTVFITQPALSRHIMALEEELGIRLFTRSKRSVELTAAGCIVLKRFEDIQDDYERLQHELSLFIAEKHKKLSLSCPSYWMGDYINPILLELAQIDASCEYYVEAHQPSDGIERVQEGTFDVAFAIGLQDNLDPEITRHLFASERLSILARPDKFSATEKPISIKSLEGETIVLVDDHTTKFDALNRRILEILEQFEVTIAGIKYANQIETIGFTIALCDGVGVQPCCVRNISREYLSFRLLEEAECSVPLCFYYREKDKNPSISKLLATGSMYAKQLEDESFPWLV